MTRAWRDKGKRSLPELQKVFDDEENTPYLALSVVKDLTLSAIKNGKSELAARAFDYAQWCHARSSEHLRSAAAVCFYEYIFDDESLESEVHNFIPKSKFIEIISFVEFAHEESPEKFRRIKRLYGMH